MSLQEMNENIRVEKPSTNVESSSENFFNEIREGMQSIAKKSNEIVQGANDIAKDLLGDLDIFDSGKISDYVKMAAVATPIEQPKKEGFPAPGYKGEPGINRDLEPGKHEVKAGDTLEAIARKHLGKDASVAEVALHAKEIAKINGIENPRMIHQGDQLKLPGHTKDGGFVTVDGDGNRLTQWQDGSLQCESKDGSKGFKRVPDGKGGTYEKGWGKESEENYYVHRDKNGELHLLDGQGRPRNILFNTDREKLKYVYDRDRQERKAAQGN